MTAPEGRDTYQKALSLNLDSTIFGSFAEIGAGQEVARWFLRVGGASGTVAKTISAYDKEVSDQLYGVGTRYVSKARLEAMLSNEWEQLLGQLHASRGADTKFFSFADTISARNYAGTNDCHGWMGLRFLCQPGGMPHEVVLHANLRDPSNVLQQEAIGILGANLIFAAYHDLGSAETFLASLFEQLGLHRVEIDCLDVRGPAFESWNSSALHALLVAGGFAEAVVFPADDRFVPPNELLYKRALVLAPGRFDSVEQLHAHLIRDTLAQLPEEELLASKGGLGLFCLSTARAGAQAQTAVVKEILEHVEALRSLGYGVMIFRAPELYLMSAYVTRYTSSRIHFAIGLTVLVRVLEDQYKQLAGTLLEGLARLFTQNVRLIVYPMTEDEVKTRVQKAGVTGWRWKAHDGMVSAVDLHPSEPLDFLYQYLLSSQLILPGTPAKRAPDALPSPARGTRHAS
jgi:hypothetical protein